MIVRKLVGTAAVWCAAAVVWCGLAPVAQAQLFTPNAGVVVDANGVLTKQVFADPTGQLWRQRLQAAQAALGADVARRSPLRKISLRRLEAAIDKQKSMDRQPTDEMKYLAGLTRVQYVFFYPETGDIVLAGPAEGWTPDLSGRIVGVHSGQPVVELQDLAAAMRAYPPGRDGGPLIGCSIDPTQEGLVKMQEFLRQIGGYATPADTQHIVNGLRTSLGLQSVRVMGVSPDTHFAQIMVEADYRMKLIGIGLEPPLVDMVTFIERADGAVAQNALFRWYFVPNYECVRTSDDGLAMELVGDGVKLVGEDEVVNAGGQRQAANAARGNRASVAFCTSFTAKYPEIARKTPVYAQLRNVIDLAVAAAWMQQQDLYGKAEWTAGTYLSEDKLAIETHRAPVQVDTAVTSVWKGNRLLTPVAGGVSIQADLALAPDNLLEDERGGVGKARADVSLKDLPADRWWWD